MKFNNTIITDGTIQKTRQWFIDNKKACIEEATNGVFFVNDLKKYVKSCELAIEEIQNGEYDHSFTFAQRAYFIQIGESVPMFKN